MKGKKLLAGLISAAMVMGTMILPAFADESKIPNWDANKEATVVAYGIGSEGNDKYFTTLKEALNAVYMSTPKDVVTLECKGDADVGAMTHAHVEDDLIIKGNNAIVSGGERDLEFDTYMYDRTSGKQISNGNYLTKNVTVKVDRLNGIAAWGQRNTDKTINLEFTNCKNMERVYISGKTGVNNITLNGCSFNSAYGSNANTSIYSNAKGNISITDCEFTGIAVGINLNNKSDGAQNISISYCSFTNCATDNAINLSAKNSSASIKDETKKAEAIKKSIETLNKYASPIRFVTSGSGAASNAEISNVGITYNEDHTVTNGDILLGDKREGEKSTPNVNVNISGTKTEVHSQALGKDDVVTNVTDEETASVSLPAAAKIGEVAYSTLADAVAAAEENDIIKLTSDISDIETLEISKDKKITIDLNGKTISAAVRADNTSKHYYAIDNYGTLTFEDTLGGGTISARGIENFGVMVINNGTFLSIDEQNGGSAVWNEGDLTINGGSFKSTYEGKASDSLGASCLNNSGTALITGGIFSGTSARTYAIISTGTITVSPSESKEVTVYGNHGAIASDSGFMVINGGSFSSRDYYGLYVSNDNGSPANVTVNGGTFSGKIYSAFIGSDIGSIVDSKIKITDGTFNKPIYAQSNTLDDSITVSGGSFTSDISKWTADGFAAVLENGKYVVKPSKATVIDTATSAATTITLNDLEKNLKSDSAIDFDGTEHAVIQVVVSAPSSEDKAPAPAKEKESNTVEMYDIKVVKTANGVSEEVPATNQSVTIGLGRKIADGAEPIVKHIKNGTFETISSVTVSDDRMSITFTAPSFSTYYVEFPAVAPADIAENINISLENEVIDGMEATYDLVISGENDKAINRFMSSEWKFESTGAVEYEIIPTANVNVTFDAANDTYELNMDGKTYSDATGRKIKLATVKITGSGNYTFGVKSAKLHAAEAADSIVTSFDSASGEIVGKAILPAAAQGTLEAKKYELSVNIAFNNAIEDNAAAYQNMQVSISGGDVNETIKLGSDVNALSGNSYTVTCKLPENIAYTVTVSGAGYRTARYTVTMTGDKVLNFWNNAKDTDVVVEEGNAASARKVTFLAGDIVRDNSINIYDLSAVVSYFGTKVNKDTQAEYAKYDLNRDGVIDSKDVAYVLVSWGK